MQLAGLRRDVSGRSLGRRWTVIHGAFARAQPRRPTPDFGRPLPAGVWVLGGVSVLSATADQLLLFAVLWSARPQGWSGAQTALVILALRLPALGGGVFGGRAVDRLGGRSMILVDAAVRCGLMTLLAAIAWNGRLPLAAVVAAGGMAGALAPAGYTGARWLVPRLAERSLVGKANAVLALADQLPMLVGAVVIAPAIDLLGPGRAMLIPALLLATAFVLARLIPRTRPAPVEGVEHGHGRRSRRRSPWRSPGVAALVGLSVAYYAAYGPFEPATPRFVREQLDAGAATYGLLWTLFGLGALLTVPLGPLLAERRPGLVNALGAVLWGAVMLPVAFVSDAPIAAVGFFIGGAIWGPYSTIEATALHRWTDRAEHGRVFGTQRALLLTATPLGAAVGALALDYAAPQTVLACATAGCSAAGLAALCLPSLRRAGRHRGSVLAPGTRRTATIATRR